MTTEELIGRYKNTATLPRKSPYMQMWGSWYKGNVKNFHNYRIFNGENYIDIEMKSMQMAKYICETWANLLLNEKCDIVLPEDNQILFNKILTNTNFWYKGNSGIEKTFALGLGALVVSVEGMERGSAGTLLKDKAQVHINFVSGYKVKPITVRNGIITECAFESESSSGLTIVVHLIENGKYVIHNHYFPKEGLEQYYKFETKSENPFFFIMTPNIANNLNDELINDELGISIFANSLDGLMDLDRKYDSFYNEGILGRKKVFLSNKAYKVDTVSNELVKTYDPMETMFYYMGEDENGKPHIDTKADELRYDSQIQGINAQLNWVGMKCGFGQSFFRFDGKGEMTATQVISENSDMFRNIKKHEILLENVLLRLTKTVIYASNEFTKKGVGEVNEEDIKIMFDDSIIEDKGAEMDRDKADVAAGLMSREEYRVKWYGEDVDTAIANVRKYFLYEKIDQYTPALTQGAMTPEQFVLEVYGEGVQDKQVIVDYITEFMAQGDLQDFQELYPNNEESTEEEIA